MSAIITIATLSILGVLSAYAYAGTRGALIAIGVLFTAACVIAAIQAVTMGKWG